MSAKTWAGYILDAERCTSAAADLFEKREWSKGMEKLMLARANLEMASCYITSRHNIGIGPEYAEVQEK